MIVRGHEELRFEQRWEDYWQVLEQGTPKSVGKAEPRPPNRHDAIIAILKGDTPRKWEAASAELNEVWARDKKLWPLRLSPFLQPLSRHAQKAFADLVMAGCQPDMLAFQFHEAAKVDAYKENREHLLPDLDELDRLRARAVHALREFADGRRRVDQYLSKHRLRVLEGEPGDGELQILLMDFEDLADRDQADIRYLRRRLDGRRESLLGHAEVRLSRRVHQATGNYHDRRVECVLEEVRERMGQPVRAPGTLKRRRGRWMTRLRIGASAALK